MNGCMTIKKSFLLFIMVQLLAIFCHFGQASAIEKGPNYAEMFQRKSASADSLIATAERMSSNRETGEHSELIEKAKEAKKIAFDDRDNGKMPDAITSLEASISHAVRAISMLSKKQSIRDSAISEREKSTKDKKHNGEMATFDRKMNETTTFIGVAQRIASKTDHPEVHSLIKASEEKKNEASKASNNGDIEKGIVLLSESYALAVQAVKTMREGQVIIRKPVFASINEEFAYEKEGNDYSRIMASRLSNPAKSLDEADKLRKSADDSAGKGNIPQALEMIRRSTALYMKMLEHTK